MQFINSKKWGWLGRVFGYPDENVFGGMSREIGDILGGSRFFEECEL